MSHDELRDIITGIDKGAYWQLLQEKGAGRIQTTLTNISGGKTLLIPDAETVEKLKTLDKSELVMAASRYIIHRYIDELSEIGPEEHIGGFKKIKTKYNSTDNTATIDKSTAVIKDIGVSKDETKPYLRIYGIMGIIEDAALIDNEHVKIQSAGALTRDAQFDDKKKRQTRIGVVKRIKQTFNKGKFNYSYLFEKSSFMFAKLSIFEFKISPDMIFYAPSTMISCLTTQHLIPDLLNREYFVSCELSQSMMYSPHEKFFRMFNGNNKTAMADIDRIEKVKTIKKEKFSQGDKFTYKELHDAMKLIHPENSDAKKLIIMNYLAYLEYEAIINSDLNTTSKFAYELFSDIFAKAHEYFEGERRKIEDHTFSAEFVQSPFFMYTATSFQKLANNDNYINSYRTAIDQMKSFADSYVINKNVGAYTLNRTSVGNIRQSARIIMGAGFDDRPMENEYRSKNYIVKDPSAIPVISLIYVEN